MALLVMSSVKSIVYVCNAIVGELDSMIGIGFNMQTRSVLCRDLVVVFY